MNFKSPLLIAGLIALAVVVLLQNRLSKQSQQIIQQITPNVQPIQPAPQPAPAKTQDQRPQSQPQSGFFPNQASNPIVTPEVNQTQSAVRNFSLQYKLNITLPPTAKATLNAPDDNGVTEMAVEFENIEELSLTVYVTQKNPTKQELLDSLAEETGVLRENWSEPAVETKMQQQGFRNERNFIARNVRYKTEYFVLNFNAARKPFNYTLVWEFQAQAFDQHKNVVKAIHRSLRELP